MMSALTSSLGKMLFASGLALAGFGLLLMLMEKSGGFRLGRLPGDISIQREGFSFFFPVTTMMLLSALASLFFWIVGAIRR